MIDSLEFLTVIAVCVVAASAAVVFWRRIRADHALETDSTFVTNTYPIIGLIYGVILGFTIVIAWGHFLDAEESTTQEVTRMSELWRTVDPLPDPIRTEVHCALIAYAKEVVSSDWDSMATSGTHSPSATGLYESIWTSFYSFQSDSLDATRSAFFHAALDHLGEMGRERRRRGLYASSEVHPAVRDFLIWGGVFIVLFSLLLPAKDLRIQIGVTAVIAGLISSSIVLALALERPFSGDFSISPDHFTTIAESFARRAGDLVCPL